MKGPDWLYEVAPDSALNAKDICAMLGISREVLGQRIATKKFPEADFRLKCARRDDDKPRQAKREWYVKTIIKHFRAQSAAKAPA